MILHGISVRLSRGFVDYQHFKTLLLPQKNLIDLTTQKMPERSSPRNLDVLAGEALTVLFAKGKNKNKTPRKGDLPEKICKVCGRPFTWRKKWEKVWDEVQYCSERCRRAKNKVGSSKDAKVTLNFPASVMTSRARFLSATTMSLLGLIFSSMPALAESKPTRFSRKEIEDTLINPEWDEELPFSKSDFARLDQSDDSLFYSTPKFVEHIDDAAVRALTEFYAKFLAATSREMYGASRTLDVLDLCSSWVSHLPQEYNKKQSRVAGLGMNSEELSRNPQLTEYVVRDLNKNPVFPYAENSFDVVVCALSIDYLIRPLSVMKQISRVLRPGGSAAIVFSNRLFLTKAVGIWTGKTDLDHVFTVGSYFHFSGGDFDEPLALDLSPSPNSDPLFAVVCKKSKITA